jgi:hypothetical protein
MAQRDMRQLSAQMMEMINARLPPPPEDWVEPTNEKVTYKEATENEQPTQYAGEFLIALSMQAVPRR